jgi:cobalt-zinc-cadmium efflux system membrane fusion protein
VKHKTLKYAAIWAAVGMLAACSRQQVSASSDSVALATVETIPDIHLVTVANPERIAVVKASARAEADQLLANGIVAADVSRTVPVNALSSGRVAEVKARLGDDVQKGQVLLTLTSPDMSQAINDYQKAQASEKLTKSQLEREQLLFAHGIVAQKDIDIDEDTYNKAKIDTATAGEHIRILGGDTQHLSPIIEISAPVSGTIIEQNVTSSAGVKSLDNAPNLFTIADLSHVWVLVDVYESDLAQVHAGDRADIELNAYPNRKFQGRVTNISKLLDPNTRSAKVRIELANDSGILRPNMFATAHFVSQGANMRTVVPAPAVLRLQDRDWVFVKVDDKQFRKTEVHGGATNPDGSIQVLSGLKAGETVVTDALMFDREVQKSNEQ